MVLLLLLLLLLLLYTDIFIVLQIKHSFIHSFIIIIICNSNWTVWSTIQGVIAREPLEPLEQLDPGL